MNTNNKLIENTVAFVYDFFKNEMSGHDAFHTLRVYKTAVKIAEAENADMLITALAALLHDVDDRKLSPETCENKDNARRFLKSQGVDTEIIERTVEIISEVSFKGSDSVAPSSLEGKCVQDADRLDAIGAIGIARAFAYGASRCRKMYDPEIQPKLNMSEEEYFKNSDSTTVNHFYEKLFLLKDMMNTESAREIAEHRDSYMHGFLDEFFKEIEL